ncbi:MAG: 3-oxoacyl-[acyl-carrier-protein] synthase III C-terminal domain-containing protein [Mycobacteriales bacterium]
MGAVIQAAATARPSHWPLTHGARRLADAAVASCLQQAGVASDDLDLLVNVGVFRERGLGEPALAALIQEDIGANLEHPPTGGHGTFSFDLDNGACGVLTGAHLVRGFLESGAVHQGVVVASDSGPGPVHADHMPYAEAGGALLLGWAAQTSGLVAHRAETFPEFEGLAQSHWSWQPAPHRVPHTRDGHNTLVVTERPGYHERAADCAAEVARRFLGDHDVTAGAVDLLIATHAPGFADALADRLGIRHSRVLHVGEDMSTAYTAAPVAAIETAMRQGRWADAHTVLLVAAGAGISVAVSLYRQ